MSHDSKKASTGHPIKTPNKDGRKGAKNRHKEKSYTDEDMATTINLIREGGQGRSERNIAEAYGIH